MLSKILRPFAGALFFAALSVIVLAYQNCAKPLEEVGMYSSLTTNCSLSISPRSVNVGQAININYVFSAPGAQLKLVVINNFSGAATHLDSASESGSKQFAAIESGSYTVYGAVEANGVSFRNCYDSFTVTSPVNYTYSWQIGAWGNCSVTACGQNGTQTRSVICVRNDGATMTGANESLCGTKPAASQSCSTQSCDPTYTYSWQLGNWSACSATACGTSGTQTRTATCKRSDGATMTGANESLCGTKPATSQGCQAPACNYTYSWITGIWGACNVSCGYGTQYRTVACQRNDGQHVSDTYCPAGSKPNGSQTCYSGQPCGGGSGGGGSGGGGGGGGPGPGGPIVIK